MPSVLVAPDSFKGTFSAVEVAEAIGRGLTAAGVEPDLCPVADGGEGTMETLLASIGGDRVEVYVLDAVRFEERLQGAAGVIAGEGRIDEQSVMGKIVGEIGERALAASVPLYAIVGRDSVPREAAERIALRSVREATTLEEIEATAERLGLEIGRAGG